MRNETAVHTLEHGAVWITYQPDLPQEQKDTIRELVEAQTCVLASPYEGLDAPVVASAWASNCGWRPPTTPTCRVSSSPTARGRRRPSPARPAPAGLRSRYDEGERFLGLQRRAARWTVAVRNWNLVYALLLVVAILVAVASLYLLVTSRPPGEGSAEAGFARDMIVHHAQAVQMAEIIRDKTKSDSMRLLVSDISLTQQAQVGIMQGWLGAWGLPIPDRSPPWRGWATPPMA